jgi:hypothetical protein
LEWVTIHSGAFTSWNDRCHAVFRQIATGGLLLPDLCQRRQHYSAWRRCAFPF